MCTHGYMSLLKLSERMQNSHVCEFTLFPPGTVKLLVSWNSSENLKPGVISFTLRKYQLGYLQIIARLVKIRGCFSVGWRKSEARPVQAWW